MRGQDPAANLLGRSSRLGWRVHRAAGKLSVTGRGTALLKRSKAIWMHQEQLLPESHVLSGKDNAHTHTDTACPGCPGEQLTSLQLVNQTLCIQLGAVSVSQSLSACCTYMIAQVALFTEQTRFQMHTERL